MARTFALVFATSLAWFTAARAEGACYRYGDAVSLSGIVAEALFPEEPNYESVKAGDAPAKRFVLLLGQPICTLGDDMGEAVPAINALQINCDEIGYKTFKRLEGEGQTISGVLEPATTGHHHTQVMIRCDAVK